MKTPAELRYAKTHEWARLEADGAVSVGITDHAQERLGDIVFVEPPKIGQSFSVGAECAVIESVKAAADIYAPVAGQVIAVNAVLEESPQSINQDAYAAWIFRIRPDNPADLESLLDAQAYVAQVHAEEE